MSFSNYPNQLDNSATLPPSIDLVTPVKAEVTNRLRDAVLSIEAELGVQPSGTYSTVRARLDALRTAITTIQTELGTNPSGSFDTVADRFDDVSDRIDSINAALATKPDLPIAANQIDASQRITIPLVYREQSSVDVYNTVGGDFFDPSIIPNPSGSRTITFRAVIYTSSASSAALVRLFNVSDGVTVSGTEFSTTSLLPDLKEVELTVPADLPNSPKSYEVQIRIASAGAFVAFCQKAELVIKWT